MADTFTRLYGATAFDPAHRQDQIGELARRTLLKAAQETGVTMGVSSGEDTSYLLGGLLVGIVQILQATMVAGDQADAAIRGSIMQIAPWAVDMARSAEGKEPLANA